HGRLRARLRAHLAGEELAVAAVDARVQLRPVLVRVRARARRARDWEGLVPDRLRRLREERARVRRLERRIGILARPRALEARAPADDLALQVPRLARDRVEILEAVEVRLELLVGDAPVLHRAVLGDLLRPVALQGLRLRLEVPREEAPGD